MRSHEINVIGTHEFSRDDKITFVLTIFVIDQNHHLATPIVLENLLNRTDLTRGRREILGIYHSVSLPVSKWWLFVDA